jgi:hypothetical protein
MFINLSFDFDLSFLLRISISFDIQNILYLTIYLELIKRCVNDKLYMINHNVIESDAMSNFRNYSLEI